MRAGKLIMRSQGQREASKKTASNGANRQTSGHRDSMTDPAQWGRVSENTTKEPLKQNKHTKGLLEVMKPGNDKQGKEN